MRNRRVCLRNQQQLLPLGRGVVGLGIGMRKRCVFFITLLHSLLFFFHVHAFTFTKESQDFPRGPVVKNLSANAADTGSISGPGALHVLHSNQSYALLLPVLSHFGRVQPCVTPWTAAHPAPLSMGVSRQEYWSGLPCPPAGDLPNPGAESTSLMSPALAVSSSSLVPPGKPVQHGSHMGKKDVKYINHFCIDYALN